MKEKLEKLSLPELESLFRLINEGVFDGDSTSELLMSYGSSYEKRLELLKPIKIEIKKRIKAIIL